MLDSNNHALPGAPNGSAIEVTVTRDTTPPVVTSIDLDLDQGTITLNFDEPVDPQTTAPSAISITNSTELPKFDFGVNEANFTAVDSDTITITLSEDEAAKLIEQFDGGLIAYAEFTEDLISDLFGNKIEPTLTPRKIDNVIYDLTSPKLLSFDLDMNDGILTLSFSEAVDGSTFSPSAISIQKAELSSDSFTLSNLSIATQLNTTVIQLNLSSSDLDGIKATPFTATSQDNTFIAVTDQLIKDLYGNRNQERLNGNALQVSDNFVLDSVDPKLLSFTFGNYNGRATLSLTFDDVVNASSIIPSDLKLQAEKVLADDTQSYLLTATLSPTEHGRIVHVPLADEDILFLVNEEAVDNLAKTQNNTFISFPTSFAADMQGNSIEAILENDALKVTNEPGDLQPPEFERFTLNLDTGTMIMVFSEEIVPSTFDATTVTIQSTENW